MTAQSLKVSKSQSSTSSLTLCDFETLRLPPRHSANRASAERLARTIIGEFSVAGLSKRAVTALGYLSEAITAKKAKSALASEVREYILSLRIHPEPEFKPTVTVLDRVGAGVGTVRPSPKLRTILFTSFTIERLGASP